MNHISFADFNGEWCAICKKYHPKVFRDHQGKILAPGKCPVCYDYGQVQDAQGEWSDCPHGCWYPNKYPDM